MVARPRIAILQARTSSTRLPAKVLLPVNGVPLVVVAARRAGNTGIPVLVATSSDETDDGLAGLLAQHGIAHMRGDLHDTLARFETALAGHDDDTIVFRLTSDNAVPDGNLLDELQAAFEQRNLGYLGCGGDGSGLPYGVSAEVTRAGLLRQAAREATTDYDREHVTPYIRRLAGDTRHLAHGKLALEQLRCTVDHFGDYLLLQRLFASSSDIVREHFLSIVERLRHLSPQHMLGRNAQRIALGTAQLGLKYGIANLTGQLSPQQAQGLIQSAIAQGIAAIDTARAYGSSEHVVGLALQNGLRDRVNLVTKLDPLDDLPADASRFLVAKAVRGSVFQSLAELHGSPDVLMLHRASHINAWRGGVLEQLFRLRDEGYINDLGVSVQSPEELSLALTVPGLTHVQLPFNVLDWRWDDMKETVAAVRKQRPLVVHARSALLQGLLPSTSADMWRRAHVSSSGPVVEALSQMADASQSASIAAMCLRFALAQPWIDRVVIGMENVAQLDENMRISALPPLTTGQVAAIGDLRPRLALETLDPARWRNTQ